MNKYMNDETFDRILKDLDKELRNFRNDLNSYHYGAKPDASATEKYRDILRAAVLLWDKIKDNSHDEPKRQKFYAVMTQYDFSKTVPQMISVLNAFGYDGTVPSVRPRSFQELEVLVKEKDDTHILAFINQADTFKKQLDEGRYSPEDARRVFGEILDMANNVLINADVGSFDPRVVARMVNEVLLEYFPKVSAIKEALERRNGNSTYVPNIKNIIRRRADSRAASEAIRAASSAKLSAKVAAGARITRADISAAIEEAKREYAPAPAPGAGASAVASALGAGAGPAPAPAPAQKMKRVFGADGVAVIPAAASALGAGAGNMVVEANVAPGRIFKGLGDGAAMNVEANVARGRVFKAPGPAAGAGAGDAMIVEANVARRRKGPGLLAAAAAKAAAAPAYNYRDVYCNGERKAWYHGDNLCTCDFQQLAAKLNLDIINNVDPTIRLRKCIDARKHDLEKRNPPLGSYNRGTHDAAIQALQYIHDLLAVIPDKSKIRVALINFGKDGERFVIIAPKKGGKRKTRKQSKKRSKRTRKH